MKTDLKAWAYAAGIRAVKTFGQAGLTAMGLGAPGLGLIEVDWLGVLSLAGGAAVVSIFTSLVGLPEVKPKPRATRRYPLTKV
jgi:hypothetical protein